LGHFPFPFRVLVPWVPRVRASPGLGFPGFPNSAVLWPRVRGFPFFGPRVGGLWVPRVPRFPGPGFPGLGVPFVVPPKFPGSFWVPPGAPGFFLFPPLSGLGGFSPGSLGVFNFLPVFPFFPKFSPGVSPGNFPGFPLLFLRGKGPPRVFPKFPFLWPVSPLFPGFFKFSRGFPNFFGLTRVCFPPGFPGFSKPFGGFFRVPPGFPGFPGFPRVPLGVPLFLIFPPGPFGSQRLNFGSGGLFGLKGVLQPRESFFPSGRFLISLLVLRGPGKIVAP